MDTPTSHPESKSGSSSLGQEDYKLFFFSQLLKRRICAGKFNQKIGRVTDLIFRLAEPFPEAVGIYVEHSMGRPNEFIPWEKVIKIDDDAIFITPAENGKPYPSFVDQKGWILLGQHFIGRTILDMDGRQTEAVNDVQLRFSKGRITNARREGARTLSVGGSYTQLGELFSGLPADQMMKMMELLPEDQATRIKAIISDLECTADALMSFDFVRAKKTNSVVQVLKEIRSSRHEPHSLSYVYLLDDERTLLGVVDLREIVLAADTMLLGDMMVSPVVSAQREDTREDLAELFARYQFHLIPVVDEHDRMLGVVYYRDIMKGLVTRARS